VITAAAIEGRLRRQSLTVSTSGLHLLLDALVEPIDPDRVPAALSDDVTVLVGAGLLGPDGAVPDDARPGVAAIRQPLCVIDLEAAVGRVPRHYRGYIGAEAAATYATDPPFPGLRSSSAAVAEYDVPPLRARQLRIVARDWPPVDAAAWVGLTPRPDRLEGTFTVPADALTRRLSDASTPVPAAHPDLDTVPATDVVTDTSAGADAGNGSAGANSGIDVLRRVWAEPLVAWGLTVDPGEARMMVLDAGSSGHYLLSRAGDKIHATGLSSRSVWNQMIAMIEAVLR